MHELTIIKNVFDIIIDAAEKEKLEKITKVNFVVGKMNQIVPDMLQFAFNSVAEGTIAEKACLEIETILIEMKCNQCNNEFIVQDHLYFCPECGSFDLKMLKGKELYIKSIEGD